MTDMFRTITRSAVVACAVVAIASSLAAAAQRGGAQAAKEDPDIAEYRAFRLTLPMLARVEAAMRSYTTAILNDPAYKPLIAAQREHDALERKSERTPAEDERMEALKAKLGASPLVPGGGADPDGDQSLDELEAEIAKFPPMANALRANGITPRDYLKCFGVLFQALIVVGAQAAAAQAGQANTQEAQLGAALAGGLGGLLGANVAPENVRFVKENQAAVERFMKAMEEISAVFEGP